jgi:hypothetical protein
MAMRFKLSHWLTVYQHKTKRSPHFILPHITTFANLIQAHFFAQCITTYNAWYYCVSFNWGDCGLSSCQVGGGGILVVSF